MCVGKFVFIFFWIIRVFLVNVDVGEVIFIYVVFYWWDEDGLVVMGGDYFVLCVVSGCFFVVEVEVIDGDLGF